MHEVWDQKRFRRKVNDKLEKSLRRVRGKWNKSWIWSDKAVAFYYRLNKNWILFEIHFSCLAISKSVNCEICQLERKYTHTHTHRTVNRRIMYDFHGGKSTHCFSLNAFTDQRSAFKAYAQTHTLNEHGGWMESSTKHKVQLMISFNFYDSPNTQVTSGDAYAVLFACINHLVSLSPDFFRFSIKFRVVSVWHRLRPFTDVILHLDCFFFLRFRWHFTVYWFHFGF